METFCAYKEFLESSRQKKNWPTNCLAFSFVSPSLLSAYPGQLGSSRAKEYEKLDTFGPFISSLACESAFSALCSSVRASAASMINAFSTQLREADVIASRECDTEEGQWKGNWPERFWISIINGSFHFFKDVSEMGQPGGPFRQIIVSTEGVRDS
jgi:hypothetical protein